MKDLTFYDLAYYFFIYSFLGWLMETCLNSIRSKTFINRGFLNGFYCPIYGFGMCPIYMACSSIPQNPISIFLIGMSLATLLEYATGFAMEKIFHATWWDYSHHLFNLKGRICLSVSLCWGGLSVIFIKLIQPLFTHLVLLIPKSFGLPFLICLILIFILDLCLSIYDAFKLSSKIPSLTFIHEELLTYLEQSKLSELSDELRKHFSLKNISSTFTTALEVLRVEHMDTTDYSMKAHQALESLQKKYFSLLQKYSLGERRLIKAFPRLSFKRRHSSHKKER